MYKRFTKSWMKHIDFIVLDMVCLYAAYFLACLIWRNRIDFVTTSIYGQMVYVLLVTSICVAFLSDNHKNILHRGYLKELKAVALQGLFVAVFVSTYLYMTKSASQFSRMTLMLSVVFYVILMYIMRCFWKQMVIHVGSNFQNVRAMLLVTSASQASGMAERVHSKQFGPIRIVGFGLCEEDSTYSQVEDIPVVALGEEKILDFIQSAWVDEVLIQNVLDFSKDFIDKCELMGVTVHQCIDLETDTEKVQIVEKCCGYTVLTSCIQSATMLQAFLKRAMDIVGGLVGLVLTGLLFLFVAPMIYISSPGPIFFSQERVGCGGRKFKIYKFRSMYMDAEERKKDLLDKNQMQGLMFKMDADPRIIGSGEDGTRKGIGWFIRKTSIDEFPQFWNVLKGDMSLVGTRPPTVSEWEQYEYHHRSRLAIKPGITGLWQVSGRSDITDFEEVVRLDVHYIRNWNLGEDIKILLRTVMVVLGGSGSK